jgi:hypothetical protein
MGAIVHLLDLIRIDAEEAEEAKAVLEANKLWKGGAYVCILMAASLRGHEGFSWSWPGFGSTCPREELELSPVF